MSDPSPPSLEFVAAVAIPVLEKPVGSGVSARGNRQLIAFPGGTVTGPGLSGRILPGGADVQLIRRDGVAEIDARYVIETERGARVFVRNAGIARAGADGLYFRTSPSFETDAPDLQWLMQHVFVGTGAVAGGGVELRWYKVI
jgi:Protein of unknown function (DUF3237)